MYDRPAPKRGKSGNNMMGGAYSNWKVTRIDREVLKRKLESKTRTRRNPWR
jgi:hypothetical protein